MKPDKIWVTLFWVILFLSLSLRLPGLDQRPMHTDEAVNALIFSELLFQNEYQYNPQNYHGPSLYYVSLLPAWITGIQNLSSLHEIHLRIVPVFFLILFLLMLRLLKSSLGWPMTIIACLLATISPAMVYYSRYYIHESLMMVFSSGLLIGIYLFARWQTLTNLILVSVSAGLLIATKETWLIYGVAVLITILILPNLRVKLWNVKRVYHLYATLICASLVILLYSSFFTHWDGLLKIYDSFYFYLDRVVSEGIHHHPVIYYLGILTVSHLPWTEGILILFAVTGTLFAFRRHQNEQSQFFKYVAVYTGVLIVSLSLIPYKTPWNLLGFMPGIILLAAFGIYSIYHFLARNPSRIIFIIVTVFSMLHLVWQSIELNTTYSASVENPYAYAHSTKDVFSVTQSLEKVVAQADRGYDTPVYIIVADDDYWPLPWYLRSFRAVGYWNQIPDSLLGVEIFLTSPQFEADLAEKLYLDPPPGERHLYMNLFEESFNLRPGIELRGFISKRLYDRL